MIVQAQAHTSITSSNHHSHSSIMPSSSSSSSFSSGQYIKCEFCSGLYGIHVGSCGCAMLNATSDAAMHAITASYNINMNANASCNNNDTGTSNNASILQMSEEEESWLVQSLAEDATTPMTSMGPTPMMGMSAPNIALSTTTNANVNVNGNGNANMNVVNYHEIDDVTNDVSCVGDFLDEIAHYLEKEQESSSNTIPFDYIDLWVPVLDESVKGVEGSAFTEHEHEHDPDHKHMKLSYAGHIVISNAHNKQNKNLFGKYSTLFSFEPGHGIVGKVYTSGQPIWESDLSSCTYFERSYGAKKYNINTCLGLPINSTIGRIVVIFYTELQLLNTATSKNQYIIHKLQKSISNHWNPFPRWKLSLESGINDVTIIPLNLNGVSPSSSAHTSPSFKPISHVKTSPVLQPTTPVITKKTKN